MKLLAILVGLLLAATPAMAEEESEAVELFEHAMVWLNIIAALACLVLAADTVRRTGSLLGRAFVFITTSTFFFASIRFFFYLTENTTTIPISHGTRTLFWHFLFYTATGLFLVALASIKSYAKQLAPRKSVDVGTPVTFFVLGIWLAVLFLAALPLDGAVGGWFDGSIWDRSGLIHFIAFAFIAYVWYQLLSMQTTFGRVVTGAATPFLIGLASFGLVHLWELLGESWKVLPLSGEVVELVETPLFLIALIAFAYAIWKVRRAIPATV